MKSSTRLMSATLIAAAVPAAFLFIRAHACGPDFEPEVFVPDHHPASPKLYADGQLGILQRGYYHAELVIAYRYLAGGRLSEAEKAVYVPKPGPPNDYKNWQVRQAELEAAYPGSKWLVARQAVAGPAPAPAAGQSAAPEAKLEALDERVYSVNCTDAAFNTAIETLTSRAGIWTANSPELKEWVRGQDAVFSNCRQLGSMPAPAQPNWPALLKYDRAYQRAAAEFYRSDFDGAVRDFEAIGREKASPWSRWGEYLAGRAEVRKAAYAIEGSDDYTAAKFDMSLLRQAEGRLQRLRQQTADPQIVHATTAELHFIDVRLDPSKRLDEASVALAGPRPDPEFQQDLTDLDYLMDHGASANSDLARWIPAIQGGALPDTDASAGSAPAPAQWQSRRSVPWLVAALTAARPGDPAEQELLSAAGHVKPDSPAYYAVNFHRTRLLLAEKKAAEARALLDTVFAGLAPQVMPSTRNALLQQRMQTARTLEEFLVDAPRVMLEHGSQAADLAQCNEYQKRKGCVPKLPDMQFDNDAASAFNQQLPLALWVHAANSNTLSQNLREGVAWAAWVRAIGVGDSAAVKQLAPLLPDNVKNTAGESNGFPATLALLRNPGLRPYLDQGVQRSASFAVMDELRDNWWCSKWGDGFQLNLGNSPGVTMPPAPGPLAFLTPQQRRAAEAERAKLNVLPNATIWLGQRTIAYVKAHPDDKDGAEALALTVRATHYSCSGEAKDPVQQALSKNAFELLHRLYPNSEWARKTKYYY